MSRSMTASQPDEADIRRAVPWLLYVIFFSVLNETLFNVSTPSISEQFHLLPSQVSWVVTIFILFFGIGSIVFGKLSDMFSPKHLMVIGIVIYAASSVLGFIFHDHYITLIFFRAIQGLGASAIPAINNTIITRYFTATRRKRMFGLVTSAFSLGVAVGPVLGGYITSYLHWSYLFLIPVLTLASIPFFLKYLPLEERQRGRLDLLGAVLMSLAVMGLILFLTELRPVYLVCSLAAGISFVMHIRGHENPFLQTELFKSPLYRAGVIVGFLMFSTIMTMMFLLPLMLSQLYALSADKIGTVMFPASICAALCGKVAGDLVVKKGARFVTFAGLSLIVLGFALIWISIDQMVWWIAAALVVMNMGYAFSQTSITESVSSTLHGSQIGIGMGLFSLGMFIAQALGIAAAAKLLEGSLLALPLHPLVTRQQSLLYVNLTLLLVLVIACSIVMYFFFTRYASQTTKIGVESQEN